MGIVQCAIIIPPPIIYKYVDLDLPTGTKWATQNVGARKPSDYGLYFQWGDTVGYTKDQVGKNKIFDWNNYKWSINGSNWKFTKYKTTGATLDLEDDAAHVNMGGDWHMPSYSQFMELFRNTITANTTSDDGINGMTFTSKKDKSKFIFFPDAGYVYNSSATNIGFEGRYWSSMLKIVGGETEVTEASSVVLRSFPVSDAMDRCIGLSVRGVLG